jgi:hypothetical protein
VTHLPYITTVYALGVLIPAAYAVDAWLRAQRAARRLAAIDTRKKK